ncbi:MAG: hypothetical protein AAF354_15160 [Pseudomonadota bacterium]
MIGGADPAAAKDATRKAPTVREAAERFMSEHGLRLKPRTREEYQRLLNNAIIPHLGKRQLRALGSYTNAPHEECEHGCFSADD